MSEESIRAEIDRLVTELWRERSSRARFEPGKSTVNYAGRVFDDAEIRALSQHMPIREVAAQFGLTRYAIYKRRSRSLGRATIS